ncbi:hypothetical protein SAMN02910265_03064 [Ruminococcus flavefaciens]|uniref:Uncharacterized protein n=1 Tax=Ruminococcus flavefaciens TaxID=1265 RepID=A0A1H6LI13_RUMFL|nr:hypothetical protein [Ruminococcus flavefaciens]SEH85695.1 hypothetical protein SAMN02910265_03064 [Ruminococcus flavefaciens]
MTFEEIKEEAKSAETLEKLFSLWKQAHAAEANYEETTVSYWTYKRKEKYPPIEQKSFVADGYISEDEYNSSEKKVLFVLREANIVMYRKDEMKDSKGKSIEEDKRSQLGFYKWFINDLKSNRPKQQEKMARMAYYLQHPELSKEERKKPNEEGMKKALASCAYMNLNKRGGGPFVDWQVFEKYIEKYKAFIVRQIKIMKPDYIVYVGPNRVDISASLDSQIKEISMWHTSYRMKGQERSKNPQYGLDKNVDCYMRKFFEKVKENER